MGKYFGTDGFRGEANKDLTANHAFLIGRYLGWDALNTHCEETDAAHRPCIVIGRDTRRSGQMLEAALAAGIMASGADAYIVGVITTPGVAYLTRTGAFTYGIMVSASHNPYQDNGIKVVNSFGEKLDDGTTAAIEAYIDGEPAELSAAQRENIGIQVDYTSAADDYAAFLMDKAGAGEKPFAGFRIGLDCANGSASELGPRVFRALGAEVFALSTEPDGLNINVACGSTHMEQLCAFVKEQGLDLGFAYDGDADRCLAVDAEGNVVNGDQLMYAGALYLKEQGKLSGNTVVTTVMSNYGLYKAFDACGIGYEKTKVGDKYVYECMSENDYALGGEQSGHIIFREFATTGDGIMTSIMVMRAIIAAGKSLADLVAPLQVYPQVLKNVRVLDKPAALGDLMVKSAIDAASEALEGIGRVLVRQSGTEPVIRVMAEAPDATTCEEQVDSIIKAMAECGHIVK